MRTPGARSAATSQPCYPRVPAPDMVPDAYPPSPLVSSHSSPASSAKLFLGLTPLA